MEQRSIAIITSTHQRETWLTLLEAVVTNARISRASNKKVISNMRNEANAPYHIH